MPNSVLSIGRYQLENLIREDVRFLFADLRTEDERASFNDPLTAKAMAMSAADLDAALASLPKDAAIVLLSEDGREAERQAQRLEEAGFMNVYIVRDGASGLRV